MQNAECKMQNAKFRGAEMRRVIVWDDLLISKRRWENEVFIP